MSDFKEMISKLAQQALMIEASGSKAELVREARANGWSGDPERYTQSAFNADGTTRALTGKPAIAYWLAQFHYAREEEKEQKRDEVKTPADILRKIERDAIEAAKQRVISEALGEALGDKKFGGKTSQPAGEGSGGDDGGNGDGEVGEGEGSGGGAPELYKPKDAKKAAAAKAAMLQAMLQAMMEQMGGGEEGGQELDLEAVKKIVRDEVAAMPSRKIDVSAKPDLPPVSMEGTHPIFEKVLRLVNAGVNVLLIGEAGVGKTHLAETVAKALQLEYSAIHCTAGASESHLMGWLLPTGEGGRFEYKAAPFVKLYEEGNSLFLFDEMDAADPNFLLACNGALANGHVHVPMNLEKPTIARGEKQYIMATANTFGNGADLVYAGRNQLDGATLDRWYMVRVEYQPALEAEILGQKKPMQPPWRPTELMDEKSVKQDYDILHKWLVGLREQATKSKLRRIVSTRSYLKAAAARAAGVPVDEIKKDLLQGWTQDELRKVGELA